MPINHIENGNKSFRVDNGIESGSWGSAHLYAMLLAGAESAEISVRVKGYEARFTKTQLRAIAEHLLEMADHMPNERPSVT